MLRDLRHDRGLSLRQLADRAGVAAADLSQIERGLRGASWAQAERLAIALGLPSDALVARWMLVIEEDA